MEFYFVPYCWAIKMNEFNEEAREYLFQYQEGLDLLKKNKKSAIPELYRGTGFSISY